MKNSVSRCHISHLRVGAKGNTDATESNRCPKWPQRGLCSHALPRAVRLRLLTLHLLTPHTTAKWMPVTSIAIRLFCGVVPNATAAARTALNLAHDLLFRYNLADVLVAVLSCVDLGRGRKNCCQLFKDLGLQVPAGARTCLAPRSRMKPLARRARTWPR